MSYFCAILHRFCFFCSILPGVGGVLPREASAFPPKLPLDEPFVAYSLDDLAADA